MYTTPGYWKNYPRPYGKGWKQAPVPGWGTKAVMAGPRMVAVGGFGDMNTDCAGPCLCPAQQALYNQAASLYPRGSADPNWNAFMLTHGPGFSGSWANWCAQQPGGGGGGAVVGGATTSPPPVQPMPTAPPPTTAGMTSGSGVPSSLLFIGAAVLIGGGIALAVRKKRASAAAA